MCAFTKQPIRNVFLRSLRYALKSRVLHASYTNQSCFEVFVLVDAPEYLCSDTLEEFLQSWNISCSCLQFDSFMEDGMITAIKRICAGSRNTETGTVPRISAYDRAISYGTICGNSVTLKRMCGS